MMVLVFSFLLVQVRVFLLVQGHVSATDPAVGLR